MSTFLELVNLSIQEAGKDQDDLTAGNFASPPDTRMYGRFKRWVQQSYKELQMVRDEWEFKSARAAVFIMPAIYVEGGSRAVAPPVGTLLQGQDTGFIIEVQQVILHSGTWLAGDAKATIYYSVPDYNEVSDFKFNELFDEIDDTLTVLDAAVFRSKGWGRYDFVADGQVTDFLEPYKMEFAIQTTGGSTIQENDESTGLTSLIYTPWADWTWSINNWAGGRGTPNLITISPDGDFEVWPRPDKAYVLAFTYTKTDGTLTAHDSTPSLLPERYHEILVWMAVRKSGMYDRDRTIVGRADEHIRLYRNSMEKNLLPDVTFAGSRYDYE